MAARMRIAQRQGLLPSHIYSTLPNFSPLLAPYYTSGLPTPPHQQQLTRNIESPDMNLVNNDLRLTGPSPHALSSVLHRSQNYTQE